jgi:iron complex outermembrane recepter protein
MIRARLLCTIVLLPIGASPAFAQDGAQSQAAEEQGDIVVTAQRREERLQDVPISVNVANAAQMERSGVDELQDIGAIVPGVNITSALGVFAPSIRGISTSSTTGENPVALYIDGVYLPQQSDGLRDLADAEQIAVLKGPQGTLFGRNATAGIIQITTRAPSFEPRGSFSVGLDQYETIKASGFVTGGLSEKLAASLSASYSHQGEGWGKNLTIGRDEYKINHNASVRAKLLFEPTAGTSLTLAADYLDRSDTGTVFQPYPGTTFGYPGFGPVSSVHDSYSGRAGYNNYRSYGVGLTAEQDLGFAKLLSITAYRNGEGRVQFDFDSTAADLILTTRVAPNQSFTQELQLLSPDTGAIKWVAGVYYFHNDDQLRPMTRNFGGPFVRPPANVAQLSTFSKETTDSFAPFAQVDWEFAERTTLTAGFRYTWETRTIEGFTRAVNNLGTVTDTLSNMPKLKAKKPSWRLALSHKLVDDTLIYASYNRGFKSGGFNLATLSNPGYLPEKLDAYEVGLKSSLFDNDLRFNISSFFYKYSNLQVATFVGITQVTTNGAAAELYGIDMDFRARLTSRLNLTGAVEVLHSKFTDYGNAVLSQPNPAGGAILTSGSAVGNRIPLAQNFVGTLAADYTILAGGADIILNVTGTYNGDYYFEPDNFLRQDDYVQLNASATIKLPDHRTSVIFSGSNLLGQDVIARNFTQTFGYYVSYKAPRVLSATLKYGF